MAHAGASATVPFDRARTTRRNSTNYLIVCLSAVPNALEIHMIDHPSEVTPDLRGKLANLHRGGAALVATRFARHDEAELASRRVSEYLRRPSTPKAVRSRAPLPKSAS